MNKKELIKRIEELEKRVLEETKALFNPMKLLNGNYNIETYTKLDKKYYFLTSGYSISNITQGYFTHFYGLPISSSGKQVSPEFTNIQELYMWVIENYKKLNNPKNTTKKIGRPKKSKEVKE